MSEGFYIKVDERYYAEHADGSAYLTSDRQNALQMPTLRVARIIASGMSGRAVLVPATATDKPGVRQS